MAQDYVITKGTNLRLFPEAGIDALLRSHIESVFRRFECLTAFAIFSAKQGWFSRKIRVLCIVHDNAEAYHQANAELAKQLDAYFKQNPGVMDCWSFDYTNLEHRAFVEAIMAKIQFTKNEPNKSVRQRL